jgi:hypothetical protein
MDKLNDYSGKLIPNVNLEQFSKETLIKLIKTYGKLYLSVDGFWFLSVREKVNGDTALDCDLWVWEKQTKSELRRIGEILDIKGNDIEAFFKIFQMSPWTWNLEYEMELKDSTYGKMTIHKCPTLEALEKEGEGRDKTFCKAVEPIMMDFYAKNFNPKIRTNFLKIPPRKTKNEICCIWEFIMED